MSTQAREQERAAFAIFRLFLLRLISAPKRCPKRTASRTGACHSRGARVHRCTDQTGHDRCAHVGSWEVRNWHLDDLATPARANTSTRKNTADASFGASTRQRKRMPRSGATPPPQVEHRRSDFEEPVRTQFSTNRTDRRHPIAGANQA